MVLGSMWQQVSDQREGLSFVRCHLKNFGFGQFPSELSKLDSPLQMSDICDLREKRNTPMSKPWHIDCKEDARIIVVSVKGVVS